MAAEQLLPQDKAWEKMTPKERQVKLAKDAKKAETDKIAKAEKDARENPTVDANGEHIQTVAEAKVEAAQMQAMLEEGEAAVEQKIMLQQ
jgi:hypothetical protein